VTNVWRLVWNMDGPQVVCEHVRLLIQCCRMKLFICEILAELS
jgi:hypothetical protein